MFAKPVSLTIAPDYHTHIKTPMDLATLEKKIGRFEYPDFDSFCVDLLLIPDNCMLYNPPITPWHKYAVKFRRAAVTLIEKARFSGILVNCVDAGTGVLPMEISPVMTGYAVDAPEHVLKYTKDSPPSVVKKNDPVVKEVRKSGKKKVESGLKIATVPEKKHAATKPIEKVRQRRRSSRDKGNAYFDLLKVPAMMDLEKNVGMMTMLEKKKRAGSSRDKRRSSGRT